jgi:DNA-directed RNA polymerase subunit L/DNA-directed RNA polymerase alpha subunit
MKITNLTLNEPLKTCTFTLSDIHVSYVNTLRRLILTGVETVAFNSTMRDSGDTTHVKVERNDTPMTNEMLADRIGLLPIQVPNQYVTDLSHWKPSEYTFMLDVKGEDKEIRHVTASDFKIYRTKQTAKQSSLEKEEEKEKKEEVEEEEEVKESDKAVEAVAIAAVALQVHDADDDIEVLRTDAFFPPHPITKQTCLIASIPPIFNGASQQIKIVACATMGTGREHARFCPVSQCSYEYTVDTDEARHDAMFKQWMLTAKKISGLDEDSDRWRQLRREYDTMQRKRCYMINSKGEPNSFDFKMESIGVLSISDIMKRACDVGAHLFSRYASINEGVLPNDLILSASDADIVGYDFLFKGQDHTLGNMLQTWISDNIMDKPGSFDASQKDARITYVGYSVPHPLRDEMILRIGVAPYDNKAIAIAALKKAAHACSTIFTNLRAIWDEAEGGSMVPRLSARRANNVLRARNKQ